jgi:rRNA maturation RNase YbeY
VNSSFKIAVFKNDYSGKERLDFIKKERLDKALRLGLSDLTRLPLVINLIFAEDSFLEGLNRRFRHKEGVTDVLSFDYRYGTDHGEKPTLNKEESVGEVYIAPDFVLSLKEEQEGFPEALVRTIAHGVLHLSGQDHQTRKEEAIMKAKEKRVIREYFHLITNVKSRITNK